MSDAESRWIVRTANEPWFIHFEVSAKAVWKYRKEQNNYEDSQQVAQRGHGDNKARWPREIKRRRTFHTLHKISIADKPV